MGVQMMTTRRGVTRNVPTSTGKERSVPPEVTGTTRIDAMLDDFLIAKLRALCASADRPAPFILRAALVRWFEVGKARQDAGRRKTAERGVLKHAVTVHLPRALRDRTDEDARARGRSRAWLLVSALESLLADGARSRWVPPA